MSRKKILWVVFDFVQAGGQRYVYEICKSLNKKKFQVDVLRATTMGFDQNWSTEYYYQATLDLGCSIYSLNDLIKHEEPAPKFSEKIARRIAGFLPGKTSNAQSTSNKKLADFFSSYDVVNFSGVGVYKFVCFDNDVKPANAIIHLLTARFQDGTVYDGFDKSLRYQFVSAMTEQTLDYELEGFTNYSLTYYPLCFDTKKYDVPEKTNQDELKLGIFTRLSPMKPLDPFFYAFKLLLEKGYKVHLNIYGAGDPNAVGMTRQLDYLYIREHVSFKGHRDSLEETLKNDGIDLIWFQSGNRQPLGYAAFEISMSGVPQIFWDFMDIGRSNPIEAYFPSFMNLTKFTECTATLLDSQIKRRELGEQQRNYVVQHNANKTHIHILEELFER